MITKANSFLTSDGLHFANLAVAQMHELKRVLGYEGSTALDHTVIVETILKNAQEIIEILRATGRKPRESKKKPGRPKGSRSKSVVDKTCLHLPGDQQLKITNLNQERKESNASS